MNSTLMNSTQVDALGWALIHSVWQGTAIAILFAAANFALRRASANVRYVLAYLALLSMPLMLAGTFIAAFETHDPIAAVPQGSLVSALTIASNLSPAPITPPHSVPLPYLTMVVWFWVAGVTAMSIWSTAGWFTAQRLKRRSNRDLPEIWQARLAAIALQLGVCRGIRLCESVFVQVPAVIGWIKPVILVPAGALLNLSALELEAVLAHELAHIRRFDYAANLLQSAIEALMFYHPAMWWIGKRIRAERENCCDDLAIVACGNRVVYARALTALEELRSGYPQFAMAATGGPLTARVRRLLGKDDPRRRSLPVWIALATVLVILFTVSSGIRLHAQNSSQAFAPAQPTPRAVRALASTPSAATSPAAAPMAAVDETEETPATPRAFAAPASWSAGSGTSAGFGSSAGYGTSAAAGEAMAAPEALSAPGASVSAPTPFAAAAASHIAALGTRAPLAAMAGPAGHREGYLAGLVDAGYTQISVDDIISLRDNGIDPKYIQGMLKAGIGTPAPKDLINLHNNGVSPEFVRKAVDAGIPSLTIEKIIHLAQNGIDLDNIQKIHALGFGPFNIEQIVELHNNGVTASLFEALKESGYTKVDAHQAVQGQQNGLSAKSLRNLREQGFKGLTFEQVVKLCRAGVI